MPEISQEALDAFIACSEAMHADTGAAYDAVLDAYQRRCEALEKENAGLREDLARIRRNVYDLVA